METILANLSSKVRRETLLGRKCLVAPLTMIVPGVLNGSQGPLLYPLEEVAANPSVWNGMPIVKNHPVDANGDPTSARDPSVLATSWMGWVFRSSAETSLNAEAWFDEEATKRVDLKTYNRLIEGKPIEVSTGLGQTPDPTAGTHNGVSYDAVARDYRPDHLAVLPDQKGACSNDDGCGVLVGNEASLFQRFKTWLKGETNPGQVEVANSWTEAAKAASTEASKRTDKANSSGSKVDHLAAQDSHDAAAFLHAKSGSDKLRLHHEQAAAAHGKIANPNIPSETPLDNEGEDMAAKLTPEQKKATVNTLVTNCDCWNGDKKKSAETLNGMTDEQLIALRKQHEALQVKKRVASMVTNADAEIVDGISMTDAAALFGVDIDPAKDPLGFVKSLKAAVDEFATSLAADESEDAADMGADEGAETQAMVGNKNKKEIPVAKPMTVAQYLAAAPPEVRSLLGNAINVEKAEKVKLVARLVANASPERKAALTAALNAKPLDDLRVMAELVPAKDVHANDPIASYLGAATVEEEVTNEETDDDDILEMPTMSWGRKEKAAAEA